LRPGGGTPPIFVDFAERAAPALHGPDQVAWLDRLQADAGNLRDALLWSLAGRSSREDDGARTAVVEQGLRLAWALRWFWHVRARAGEVREWRERLEETLATLLPEAISPLWRARALHTLGGLAWRQHDPASAERFGEQSQALFESLGDEGGVGLAHLVLGLAADSREDIARARAHFERGVRLLQSAGDRWGVALCLFCLGEVARRQEDLPLAETLTRQSLHLSEQTSDKKAMADALCNLGEMALARADWGTARTLFEQSRTLHAELRDTRWMAHLLNCLGLIALRQDDPVRAAALHRESLRLYRERGELSGIASSVTGLARVAHAQGHAERAARLLGAEESLRAADGDIWFSPQRTEHESRLRELRAVLGEEVLGARLAEGHALTPEQAVADALATDQEGGASGNGA
jgi:tetratricopeptide (TPR) repeat protein